MIGLKSERFQEAFERFENVVDIRYFRSYRELLYSFERWSGRRWIPTNRQLSALYVEAQERGFGDAFIPFTTVRVKWAKSYKKRVKRTKKIVAKKYKGIGEIRIKALSWYVSRGYSANKIQNRMKNRGLGIRRQVLLRIVREMRMKQKKV